MTKWRACRSPLRRLPSRPKRRRPSLVRTASGWVAEESAIARVAVAIAVVPSRAVAQEMEGPASDRAADALEG